MPDIQLLLAFFASAAVFAYAPGPSTLYAAAQTIAGGRKQGLQAALGLHLGGYFHVAIVAMGVASLFMALPMAYTAMKVVGGLYLCVLGIKMWRSTGTDQHDQSSETRVTASDQHRVDRLNSDSDAQIADEKTLFQSALVEILNPKTAIFYLAFLPQFTDLDAPLSVSTQLIILGSVVNILFSSADLICVIFASRVLALSQQSAGARTSLNQLAGFVLALLGLNLLI